jgi:hypothetical protein
VHSTAEHVLYSGSSFVIHLGCKSICSINSQNVSGSDFMVGTLAVLKKRMVVLTIQLHWGLSSNCCPGRNFKFVVTLNAFVTIGCTEANSMYRIKSPCSGPKTAFRG